MAREPAAAGTAGRGIDIARDAHGTAWSGAPATGRGAAGRMPYFDTPQK